MWDDLVKFVKSRHTVRNELVIAVYQEGKKVTARFNQCFIKSIINTSKMRYLEFEYSKKNHALIFSLHETDAPTRLKIGIAIGFTGLCNQFGIKLTRGRHKFEITELMIEDRSYYVVYLDNAV